MLASAERKWLALALLCAVQFMVVLDIAIVNVALPSIQDDLGFSQENLQWVISAYALFFGGFLLLGGRAADLLGRRRVFIGGTILFTLSSLLAGLAWSEASLIAARGFQGLGAAVITPAALSILMTTFAEGKERNTALGAWGGGGGVRRRGRRAARWRPHRPAQLGVDLLHQRARWPHRSRVDAAAARREPRSERQELRRAGRGARDRRPRALVFGITQASDYGWASGETIGIFVASAALLVGFLVWEVRAAEPLMPLWIFRIRTVAGANVAGLTLGTAVFAMFLMLTLYMQQVLAYSPMKTGVAYLAVAGTAIIWSFVASVLVTRVGVKPVLVAGMAMLTAGLVYFTQVSVDGSYAADLLPGFLLIAVGLGFSFVSISIAALAGVRHSEAGLASGLLNTSQQVGGALGVAVLATVATARTDDATATGSALPVALTDGFEAAFIVGAAIAFAGVLVGLFAVRREDLAQHEAEEGLVLEPALELDEAA